MAKRLKICVCILSTLSFGFSFPGNTGENNEWKVPLEADKLVNPLIENKTATEEGKKIYAQICTVCHGEKGKGDGAAGIALSPKPGNFTSEKVQQQTDGALFWKLTEGRPPMASYKNILTETQRWQLVNYLRTFKTIKK